LAVHLNRQVQGWRVVHPRTTPEVVEPDPDAAKARAQTLALASLPVEARARRRIAADANRLPSGAHLLNLQALPPEQRKIAPVEVLDAARLTIPVELVGSGHRFANAPRLDPETRKAILNAELDPPRITPAVGASIERRAVDARIVQDTTYPDMYRVMFPDGSLSDMVNYARALDACSDLAETVPPQAAPAVEELVSVSGAGLPALEDGIPGFLRRLKFDRAAE
jgi:hypothetical protein